MNVEFFIAKRIAFNKQRSFSSFIIKMAIAAIALSVTVMIISTSVVTGFQKEISEKIFGFWGHIHIKYFEENRSYEEPPIKKDAILVKKLMAMPDVKHVQSSTIKGGIIKTADNVEGVVLKGIGDDFNWGFFKDYIKTGNSFEVSDTGKSNDILISTSTADRLKLKVGDKLVIYFIQLKKNPKARKFNISGIYRTGIEEYDKMYALVDNRQIQSINDWDSTKIGGYEVFLKDIKNMDTVANEIYYNLLGNDLYVQTIREINPNIFDWLGIQDTNEKVILTLMMLVGAINMITVLLILILERSNMIGILKALGASNWAIRKVFLYNAGYLILIGLLWGNALGIGLCLIQKYFAVIKLPEESYYLTEAPIHMSFLGIMLVNAGTFLLCLLMLIIPSYLVTKITPVKAIRFS